jgi:catechol 2,3-dioxygenase-like lactoylglutathione lyase family enzyme
MKIERIDHLNLTVADIDRSVAFYQRVLGMKTESMGEGRAALYFGQQKIHLDAAGRAMATSGEKRMPAHICFITEAPMSEVTAHLESCGVPVRMQGPRRGDRHDPIGLYRRPRSALDRDCELLSVFSTGRSGYRRPRESGGPGATAGPQIS